MKNSILIKLSYLLATCMLFVVRLNADLFVETVNSATAGVPVSFDYISTDSLPINGEFHKAVVIIDGIVFDEELDPSGTLTVTFEKPGAIDYVVRTYGVEGDALDSVERTINVWGVAVTEPEDNFLIGLGSRLYLGASAIFDDQMVDYVYFDYQASGSVGYNEIQGSRDYTYPYAMLWEPPSIGVWEIRAVAVAPNGTKTSSAPVTLQVSAGNFSSETYVTILDPSEGSSVQAGIERLINVDVSTRGEIVRGVDMYVNGELISSVDGMDIQFPFQFSWTPMRPGSYSLVAIATDNGGMLIPSSEIIVFASDDRPHLELMLPADGATFQQGKSIQMAAVAVGQGGSKERVAGVEFLVNGNAIPLSNNGTTEKTDPPYVINWTPEFPGQYFLSARVVDSETGASYQSPSITVNIEQANPPVAVMLAPYNGDLFYAGESVRLRATAWHDSGIIQSIDFFVNQVNVGTGEVSDGAFNLDYTFDTQGSFSIFARATTDTDRLVDSNAINVEVEPRNGVRPTISFDAPTSSDGYVTGDYVQLSTRVNDTDGNITEVQFYSNQTAIGEPVTSFPFVYNDYVFPSAGRYRFEAVAKDNDGNYSTRASVEVTVNDPSYSRPTVSITNPDDKGTFEVGNSIFIEVDANDGDGNIAQVDFTVNGVALEDSDTSYPYQSTFYTIQSPGLYSVVVTATDNDGNLSIPARSVFYAVPPVDEPSPAFDPLTDVRDFLIQLYLDLFSRGPTNAELNRYLEKLEFGAMTRTEVVLDLYDTAEFENLYQLNNAYQAVIGEWADPLEFASALGEITPDTTVEPVTSEDDVGDTIAEAQPMASDGQADSFSGTLESSGDVDVFTFQIEEETLVTIYTTGPFDTIGALGDADGYMIEYDDDSGEFFNFAIQRALLAGTYYISVGGYGGSSGTYTLNVSFGSDFEVPQDSEISNAELDSVIQFLYDSATYENRYGPVQSMDSDNNRRSQFEQLFVNRYGDSPTAQQLLQGSSRINVATTLASFTASFIRNDRVGLTDYIYNLPDVSSRDDAAFLIRTLWKERPDLSAIEPLLALSLTEKIDHILSSPNYTDRFGGQNLAASDIDGARIETSSLASFDSVDTFKATLLIPTADGLASENPFEFIRTNDEGWKHVEWLGWISDGNYPWIYHEKLGWIQVNSKTPEELWIWHDKFDWSYFAKDTYPVVYRYSDEKWVRIIFGDEPGQFELVPVEDGTQE